MNNRIEWRSFILALSINLPLAALLANDLGYASLFISLPIVVAVAIGMRVVVEGARRE